MKNMKYNVYELMGKLDPQYDKILKEQKEQYHNAIPYNQLPEEDKNLFNQIFNIRSFDRIKTSHLLGGVEGSYVDTKEVKYWDSPEGEKYKQQLNQKVEQFNQNSQSYNMKITDYQDYEVDPGERFWNAHYEFIFMPKE